MGKENVFPLRKEKGRMKNIKKKIWTDESKKVMTEGWKKKWRNTKSEKHKKKVFLKWKIHKKDTKKSRMKRSRRKEKTRWNRKKGKIHRKKRSKNRYSFKRRRSKKIGETRIEYKRDVKHIKSSKTFSKIKVFFFFEKESQKKWWDVSKTKGFFGSRSWKNKKLEMQKATTKVQKKKEEEIKNTCT